MVAAQKKPSIEGALAEGLDRFVGFRFNKSLSRKKNRLRLLECRRNFETALRESWMNGEFIPLETDYNSVTDFALDRNPEFADLFGSMGSDEYFRNDEHGEVLREDIVDALSMSQFEYFCDQCIRIGTYDECSGPNVDTILNMIGRMNVDCCTRDQWSNPTTITTEFPGLACYAEDETTPIMGLEDPFKVCFPDRCKIKFFYALKREICGDVRSALISAINTAGDELDRNMAMQIVPLLFHAYKPGESPWNHCRDDIRYETYYPEDPVGANPWENRICRNTDFDGCSRKEFWALRKLMNRMKDFKTGKLIKCCDTMEIISADEFQADLIGDMLGAVIQTSEGVVVPPGCQTRTQFNRGAVPGFNREVKFNEYITEFLELAYMNLFGPGTPENWNEAQVRQAVSRSFVVGCPRAAFRVLVEWERETVERVAPNTLEYFENEIVWAKKWLEKWGLYVYNPQAVGLILGLPDGRDCAVPLNY